MNTFKYYPKDKNGNIEKDPKCVEFLTDILFSSKDTCSNNFLKRSLSRTFVFSVLRNEVSSTSFGDLRVEHPHGDIWLKVSEEDTFCVLEEIKRKFLDKKVESFKYFVKTEIEKLNKSFFSIEKSLHFFAFEFDEILEEYKSLYQTLEELKDINLFDINYTEDDAYKYSAIVRGLIREFPDITVDLFSETLNCLKEKNKS